ncbi:MAG TPA: hypothetical protein VFE45_12580, partial [Coriobacteriia bacterium]|nr:hypothetical protein [Coriobacteriia bacterium]
MTESLTPRQARALERSRTSRSGRRRLLLGAIAVVLVLAIVAAVRGGEGADEGAPVELTLETTRAGDDLELGGATNLPDGALLAYEVGRDYGDEPPPAEPYFTAGTTAVADGRYQMVILDAPRGRIEVCVAFQTVLPGLDGEQPAE